MQGRIAPAVARLLALPENERVLGAYQLVRALGRGGFAPVWLAREVYGDTELRTVAVKLFALDEGNTRPGMGTTGSTIAAQHKRDAIVAEARALCQVEHPNVVRFFAIATDASGDVLGLAMEFVQGTPLDARLDEKQKLSVADAIEVGRAVASALAAVHAVGLVHRDVKPANVIDAAGVYKLIDFGVAASRDAQKRPAPAATTRIVDDLLLESDAPSPASDSEIGGSTGTMGYIDPACMLGAAAATPASDLYSLGAMLFECVTGALPSLVAARRAGAQGMSPEVLDGRARSPALADVVPDVATGFARMVDALLDPEPGARPRSAEAVAWELERLRREVAGRARPIPPEEKGPFRGLGRFEESDRDVYFGRGVETAGGLEMVRAHGLVALIGPSGSGKSSLARAGIVPAIVDGDLGGWPRRWDAVSFVPGADPRASLCAALRPLVQDADDRSPEGLVAALAERTQREGRGTVVLVDQLEEIVTLASDEGRAFLALFLARVGGHLIPGVRCVVTARRDLLDELLALGELGRVLTRGSLFVAPLTDAAWEDVVDRALEAYGYRLEDDELRSSLLAQLEGTASAMPLVQFALTELWSRRDQGAKVIPRAALDAIGGIAGALEMHADATLRRVSELAPDADAVAHVVLVALTTAKGSRATKTLAELRARAPGDATTRVIDALEEARLVVQAADGLTLAHEALLSRWGLLRTWVEEAREDRLAAEEVEREAAAWNDEKRPADRLLGGRRLRAATALAARSPEPLGDVALGFLAAGRARQRRARGVAAIPVVLFLGLAAFAVMRWDAQRVKVSHCGGYVRRWHVMECVAPLDEVARAKRAFSYRFRTQEGRVLEVERVGRTGELRNDEDRDVAWDFRWDGAHLREGTVRDRRGQILVRRLFSDDLRRVERRDAFGYPQPLPGTKAAVILYDFDAYGFVSRERFQTIRGAPTPDDKQALGYAWTANALGFQPLQQVLGLDGAPSVGKDGVSHVTREFDAYGNIVEERLLDESDHPVLGELGYASRTLQYDASGSLLDERFFDTEHKPIAARLNAYEPMRSHARRAIARDSAGNPAMVAYYDAHDALTPHDNWACGWAARFDEHGREVERGYFGADMKPMTTSEGYALRRMTYDAHGNEIERKYFAPDGEPTTHSYGNAAWRKTFDASSYETEYTLMGLKGEPALVADGFARVAYKWDSEHHIVEEAYFGLGDKPVQPRHLGYARKTNTWQAGKLVEIASFGSDGAPVLDDGSAKETHAFDAWGNEVEVRMFGVNGRPTRSGSSAGMLWKYDDRGNQVETSYIDVDGRPAKVLGFARRTTTYDDLGRPIEEAYFDADGVRTTDKFGQAGWRVQYDAHGRVIERVFVDTRGQPALSRSAGYVRSTMRYDAQGREIERAFFGRDGQPTLDAKGDARITIRYDAVGDAVETTHYDAAGGVVLVERMRNDDRHRLVEIAYFDRDGHPALGKSGFARRTTTFDERGLEVEGAHYDEHDALVVAGYDKVARWTKRYDGRGLEVERAFFGADGKPILKDGAARILSAYDALGHKTEEHAFGTDDKPIARLDGSTGTRSTWDEVGRETRHELVGRDGETVIGVDGVAGWTSRYDGSGNEIERAFFGKGGAPVADKKGAAKWTSSFDERRNEEEKRWFGVDGKPARVRGCAFVAQSFDDRGKLVERACFDEHDAPANDESGVARETHRYDTQGNDVEEAFYDKDALLVVRGGYARKTSRYDARGNAVENVYYGGDGRPVLFRSPAGEAWRITRAYDDRAELLMVALHGIDGKLRAEASGVAIQRFKRDDRGDVTEEALFDAADKPVVSKDLGFARRTVKYNERGNAIETAYYGTNGERLAPKKLGYARAVRVFDARGNEVETRFLDAADRPTAGPDGCALLRSTFDARDNEIEHACLGADEKPTRDVHGIATWRASYVGASREVERRTFGIDDALVEGKQGWARRTIAYDANGTETARAFYDAKGAVVHVKGKGE